MRFDDISVISAATLGLRAASHTRDTAAARVLEALGERFGDVTPAPVDQSTDHFTNAAYRWRVQPRFAAPLPEWYLAIDFHEKARRSGSPAPDGYTPRRLRTDREDLISFTLSASFGQVILSCDDVERINEFDSDYEIEHLGSELARRRDFDLKIDFDPRTLTRALDLWCTDLVETSALLETSSVKTPPSGDADTKAPEPQIQPNPAPALESTA